ncbi:MAG: protein kinase [Candidatus Acidiferrales bacterium]
MIGQTLGPYHIVGKIGAGGMGEVYRARDTRLNRMVAVKVLPTHLADRPELRERFEREARTIGSLNHPHICTLHDIGHQDGIDYLVMEYLEGETLAQRLAKGPLPLEQVLQYAIEIADALDKAHRKGVTHRDLKPGNVMLSKSGSKLLDFGLAKLKPEAAPATVPFSQLPTAKDAITAQGTILGTLQYMAPEQLEGKEADARTDIFAFGVVVYEMATGKKAFEGKSQASVIGAILKDDPPSISSLQPMTPPSLDRVVKACLAKEPDERWQTASDLCRELKWIAKGDSSVEALHERAQYKWVRALPWVLAGISALVLVALIIGNTLRAPRPPTRPSITRFVVVLPPSDRLPLGFNPVLALAPDGSRLVYVANHGGSTQLYLRSTDRFEATAIPGTEGGGSPFFSPDGQSVGFFAGGKLKKVSLSGGAPLTLCSAPTNRGGSWGPDGTIVFTPSVSLGLFRVSAAGGTPTPLTALDRKKGELSHRWPEILPGGKAVLFTTWTGATFDDARIGVLLLETGEQRVLVEGGTYARYVPSGHLVYARAGGLLAVPFDLKRLEVTGTPVSLLEGVSTNPFFGVADFSTSADGSLAYVPGGSSAGEATLSWVDRNGATQALPAPPRAYMFPRLSPDGQQLAVGIQSPNPGLWLYELGRGTLTRLSSASGIIPYPTWTPDGKRVTFLAAPGGPVNIYWMAADGSGAAESLTTGENYKAPGSWSPDGRVLAFTEQDPTAGWKIWVQSLEGDRKARPFLQTTSFEGGPMFSPDGHWLAYESDESGRVEVYVTPFPGPGGKWQISTEGGTEAVWARNGRELFYRNGDKMMAAAVETKPAFAAGKPKLLFEGHYETSLYAFQPSYDVSPDGKRFLMVKASERESVATRINVVLNWFEELKRRVPTGTK